MRSTCFHENLFKSYIISNTLLQDVLKSKNKCVKIRHHVVINII